MSDHFTTLRSKALNTFYDVIFIILEATGLQNIIKVKVTQIEKLQINDQLRVLKVS